MSGIPVYTMSPINPLKASGTTPQTSSFNSNVEEPATTTASSPTPYMPAQPGPVPGPRPTGSSQRYSLLQPTPIMKTDGPPPPQPGAVPMPKSTGIIPPPRVGENPHLVNSPSQSTVRPYPAQMSIPPPHTPVRAQPPASSTSATTTASNMSAPAFGYGAPRQSLEHPPGYQQNTYASEFTSDQRRAQNTNSSGLSEFSEGGDHFNSGDLWKTAKQWASTAGTKISETEAEIWRRFTKD